MRPILFLFLLCISHTVFSQTETTIYDQSGNATHYIEHTRGIIYSFDGEAMAFLKAKSNYYNIYAYDGKHLGWYEGGVIRDHGGDIAGFQKNAVTNVFTKLEPLKHMKHLESYRPLEEIEPLKPLYSNQFSRISLSYYFNTPATTQINNLRPYSNQTYVPQIEPWSPDFNFLGNVLNKLQERHDNLIRNGYIYDEETEQYIHESQFENVKQERIKQIAFAIKELSQTGFFKNHEPVKDGRHKVYYFNVFRQVPVLYSTHVIVKNNKIKKILVNDRKKWPAFESTTIDQGMAVSRFKSGSGFSNLYQTITYYPKHFFMFVD